MEPMMTEQDALRRAERSAIDLLNEQSEAHDVEGVYSLLSGGDDSLATALVTSQADRFRGCVHLDTGIGIPETREFVEQTCKDHGWPLRVYAAVECGQDYEALCVEHGFPGPAIHYKMFARLKERPLRAFIRAIKRHRHDRIVLSTGARSAESARRMGHVQPVRREGVKVWVNPLHDWTKADCMDYITARGARRNPVVELIHMSGECLCGSFAKPGELKEIAFWFPHVGARIAALEERVREAGVKACVWGQRPPGKGATRRDSAGRVNELCQQCELEFA